MRIGIIGAGSTYTPELIEGLGAGRLGAPVEELILMDIDAERLAFLEERLNLLQTLKRKYGQTLSEVAAFGVEARRRLEQLEGRDAELVRLDAELQRSEEALRKAGDELSAARRKLVAKLSKAAGKPVKLVWQREDDIKGGKFRPATAHYLEAGLDAKGIVQKAFEALGKDMKAETVQRA